MLRANRRAHRSDVHHLAAGPVFYAICVLDLKIVKWDRSHEVQNAEKKVALFTPFNEHATAQEVQPR